MHKAGIDSFNKQIRTTIFFSELLLDQENVRSQT